MNRPIRVMAIACLVLFVALMANINYVQYVDADDLNARPGNNRVLHDEFSRDRGPIIVGRHQIALSVPVNDEFDYQRTYRQVNLYANLTGFYSYINGATDLESSQNSILSGSDPRLFVNRVIDLLSSEQSKGGSVELTINPQAQRAAYDGLRNLAEGSKGAVVALNPSTGAIQAMVSVPGYNPNKVASHDFNAAAEAYQKLIKDPENPLRDRSREEIYPPGSTFKLVTAAAALANGYDADSAVDGNDSLSFPGIDYTLRNEIPCGGGQITMAAALANSCNVAFGDLGLKLGPKKIQAQAEAFGFGDSSYLDGLSVAPSQFIAPGQPDPEGPQLAQSAIGQYNTAATPLQMAMVAAGIANDGVVMKPYIVSEVRSPDAEVLDRTTPDDLSDAMTSDDAEQLTQMMQGVVTSGTASGVANLPPDTAAKTGTAQRAASQNPYAWFVAFAPATDPQVAVAVFVQDASGVARDDISGSGLAGPIAADVMNAVLNSG
jgi:penicillin-binding protein A